MYEVNKQIISENYENGLAERTNPENKHRDFQHQTVL
jgi:hypothetical protein